MSAYSRSEDYFLYVDPREAEPLYLQGEVLAETAKAVAARIQREQTGSQTLRMVERTTLEKGLLAYLTHIIAHQGKGKIETAQALFPKLSAAAVTRYLSFEVTKDKPHKEIGLLAEELFITVAKSPKFREAYAEPLLEAARELKNPRIRTQISEILKNHKREDYHGL